MKSHWIEKNDTLKMNDLMSNVSSYTQRAISEAINEHVLPRIQATLRSE